MNYVLLGLIAMLFSQIVQAQYYNTLPAGVRLLSTRYIQSEVSSSYNHSQSESPYKFEINTDINDLEQINNQVVKDALEVFKEYPEAYSQLSLGTHKIDADAKVNVDVYAFGYGITNKATAYIGIPIYKADVQLKYKKVKNSSNKEVAETLQGIYGDDFAQSIGNVVENFYNLDARIIQSAVVNKLGYEKLGGWSGNGLGDIEVGLLYNFLREDKYGLMLTPGLVLPTGYVDDPDILQDIGFGDGQMDAFLEFGGGYFYSDNAIVNIWSRYTYQFESEKELRVPFSEEIFISDDKRTFREKLGNKLDIGIDTEIFLNDWFMVQPSFIYKKTEIAKYESSDSRANTLLSRNSDSESQSFKLLTELSSVNLFQKKEFLLPGKLRISFQKMVQGKNTAKVDLLEVDLRIFF